MSKWHLARLGTPQTADCHCYFTEHTPVSVSSRSPASIAQGPQRTCVANEGGCDDATRRLVCVLCKTCVLTAAERKKGKKASLSGAQRNCTPAIQNRRINNEKCATVGSGGAAAAAEEGKDETANGGKRNLMSDAMAETPLPVQRCVFHLRCRLLTRKVFNIESVKGQRLLKRNPSV